MGVRLEHANLIVRDVEGMIEFLRTAFPDFRIRGEGTSPLSGRWVHIGTEDTYPSMRAKVLRNQMQWVDQLEVAAKRRGRGGGPPLRSGAAPTFLT